MFVFIIISLFIILYILFLHYIIQEDFQNKYRDCQIYIHDNKYKKDTLNKLNYIISKYNYVIYLQNQKKIYQNKIVDIQYTKQELKDIYINNKKRKDNVSTINKQIISYNQNIHSYNTQLSSYNTKKQHLLQNLPKTRTSGFLNGLYYIIYNENNIIYHNVLHDFNNIYYPDKYTSIHIKGLFKSNKPTGRWFFNLKNTNKIQINDTDNNFPLIFNLYYKINIILYNTDNITFQHHSDLESSTFLDELFFSPLKHSLFYHSLNWNLADGYAFDNINYFKNNKIIKSGKTSHINSINFAFKDSRGNVYHMFNPYRETYMIEIYGYFKPNITGNWTFSLSSDDMSCMWINTYKNQINYNNIFINNNGLHGMVTKTNQIYLIKNKLYPIYILFGENTGGDNIILTIKNPQNQIIQKHSDLFITFHIDNNYDNEINNIYKYQQNEYNKLQQIYNLNQLIIQTNKNIQDKQELLDNINNKKIQLNTDIKIDDDLYNNTIKNINENKNNQEKIDKIESKLKSIDDNYKNDIESNLNHFHNLKSNVQHKSILPIIGWKEYAHNDAYGEDKSFKSTKNSNDEVSSNWNCFRDMKKEDNNIHIKYKNNDIYKDNNNIIHMTFSKKGKNPIYYIY
jgi:hypothetical protein